MIILEPFKADVSISHHVITIKENSSSSKVLIIKALCAKIPPKKEKDNVLLTLVEND